METNEDKIKAIIQANKEKIEKLDKIKVSTGTAVGAAVGAAFFGVGASVGAPIGTAIGWLSTFIKSNKSIWSGLSQSEKEDLIQGLIMQAVFVENYTGLEGVKNYVVSFLQKTKPQITKLNNVDFYKANKWVENRIKVQLNKALQIIKIAIEAKKAMEQQNAIYLQKRAVADAYIYHEKIKAGKRLSSEEMQNYKKGVEVIKSIYVSKQIKGKK